MDAIDTDLDTWLRQSEARDRRAAEMGARVPSKGAVFSSDRFPDTQFMLTRTNNDPRSTKPWRMTRVDQHGAAGHTAGHTYHDSPADGIRETERDGWGTLEQIEGAGA